MAYPRFPSKERSLSKALSISLGWRVLWLSLALIAFPLILFSCLLVFYVAEIKREEVIIELGLIAQEQKMALDQKISYAKRFLRLAKIQAESTKDQKNLSRLYQEMTADYPEEILVLSQNVHELGWINIASSEPALEQMRPPCEELLMPQAEDQIFIQSCLWDNRNMILFSQLLGAECRISFLLPLQASTTTIGRLPLHDEQIRIRFLEQGIVLESSQPPFNPQETLVVPYEQIVKIMQGKMKLKIPRKVERIATQLPIDQTSYEMMVDFPLKIGPIHHHILSLLFWISSFLLVIGGGLVYWLTRKMARPLESLAMVMHQIENGRMDVRYNQQPMGFEFNQLGASLNQMLTKMFLIIQEREKQTIEKELLAKELAVGHEIQKNLFPRSLPALSNFDIAAQFHPANALAGDFYDFFLSKGKLLIVIADAAGKGISACLYSLLLRGMLRSLVESGHSLDTVVLLVQKLLLADAAESSMFITAWIGLLDIASLELSYASLGHFPALLRRGASILELSAEGGALGVETYKKFTINRFHLEAQDLLLLYTDGFVEAFHKDRNRIVDKLKILDADLSSAQVLEQMIPPPPYEDDLTLTAIRIA